VLCSAAQLIISRDVGLINEQWWGALKKKPTIQPADPQTAAAA